MPAALTVTADAAAPRMARRRRQPSPLPAHLRHLLPVLHNRTRIEALVEHLVELLDALDGEADREEDEDAEPDQHGACEAHDDDPSDRPGQMYACRGGVGTPEDAEPAADDEPDMVPITWVFADGQRVSLMAQRFRRRAGA